MRFGSPESLALFAVVGVILALIVWLTRWQRRARQEFAGGQAARWSSSASILPFALLIAAAVSLVVAAARPQWGDSQVQREIQGIDLVIVLDVSQSMLATDAQPTRLALAQDELIRLVDSLRGHRIGLVFFAGTSIVRSPLSTDTHSISEIIRRAETEMGIVRAGSDLGAGLQQAGLILDASESPGKAVLIVSDGEDHVGQAAEQAAALASRGISVFAAGVGTPQGSPVQERTLFGETRIRTGPDGTPIVTRLDEGTLRAIAEAGGGRYIRLTSQNRLAFLRDDLLRLEQTPSGEQVQRVPIERFQYFAGLAFVLLCLAWLLPAPLPAVLRRFQLRGLAPRPGIAMLVLALLFGAACGRTDSLRADNEAANRLYEAGAYQAALDAYQRLLVQRPDIDELSYNVGNALHRLGSYERALAETRRALPPTSVALGAKTWYAIGNHLLALDRLEEAFEAYRSALLLEPNDADAKHNLEYVLLRLNQRQQPPLPGEPAVGPPQPGDSEPQPGPQGGNEGDEPGQQEGQPQGDGQGGEAPPQPGQQLSPAEAQRSLAEALAGLEEEISPEEAIRILDLLRQLRQTQQPGRQNPAGGPDW